MSDEIPKPSIGRIIHIVPSEAARKRGVDLPNFAEAAPAIVTACWGGLSVNCRVFTDSDENPRWETSVPHESATFPTYDGFVWRWPPRT